MSGVPKHLVLIPAYNPGRLLASTVAGARAHWTDVWVVVDGSTDGSHLALEAAPGLRVLVRGENGGKGAAVLEGARLALEAGFTHALVMDADGQHPAASVPEFMAASARRPEAVVCGRPVFGPEAPRARLYGRRLSVGLVRLETGGRGAADPLFGFRVYPLAALLAVLGPGGRGRRYDFDPEAAVRLAWAGVPTVNLDAPCAYVDRRLGGVSHYRYLRDNLGMVALHARLLAEILAGRSRRAARGAGAAALLAAIAGPALGAQPEATPLGPGRPPGEWAPVIASLAAQGAVEAPFTERRYFPFRREPTVLAGVIRLAPGLGLSLQYLQPSPSILIADSGGLVIREPGRPDRELGAASREGAAVASLLPILRFDLAALSPRFAITAAHEAAGWRFQFEPRADEGLGSITVEGEGSSVARIEFRRSSTRRVEIEVGANRSGIRFTPEEKQRFFR